MPDPLSITSAANPRIKAAVKLRRSRDRRKSGLFLAEGPREVRRAIDAGLDIIEVFHCPELIADPAPDAGLSALSERTCIYTVTEPLLKMLSYRDAPEGVIAVVSQPVWSLEDLSALPGAHPGVLPASLPGAGAGAGDLFLVAVGTAKPGNLGAMARSAEAAGCKAVLACGTPVDAFNPNAIRASTCAVYTLPIVNVDEDSAIKYLRGNGIRIAATTPDTGCAELYTAADLTGPLALVIGPEDTGLSDTWLAAADVRLTIPTLGQTVDSLNAANAAAVLLFEAVRQRSKGS